MMAEYIEREKLPQKRGYWDDYSDGWDDCLDTIAKIPAADVALVVRCKDCKFYQHDKYGGWCFNNYENPLADEDFCSHGKKREES